MNHRHPQVPQLWSPPMQSSGQLTFTNSCSTLIQLRSVSVCLDLSHPSVWASLRQQRQTLICMYPLLFQLSFNFCSYGPFWIATTLVFILAMAGNLYAFFKSHFKVPSIRVSWLLLTLLQSDGAEYITNFQVILVGAGVFYGYVIVIPFVFWGVFKYLNVCTLTFYIEWS